MTTCHFEIRLRSGKTIVSLGETYAYGDLPIDAMRMLYKSVAFDERAVVAAAAKDTRVFLEWVDKIAKEGTT